MSPDRSFLAIVAGAQTVALADALLRGDAGPAALAVSVALAAPWALALGGLAALAARGARQLLGGASLRLFERDGAIVIAAAAGVLVLAGLVPLIAALIRAIHTPAFAAVAALVVVLVGGLLGVGLALALYPLAATLRRRVSGHPRLTELTSMGGVLLGAALAGGAALALVVWRSPALASLELGPPVLSGALGLLVTAGVARLPSAASARRPAALTALAVAAVALGVALWPGFPRETTQRRRGLAPTLLLALDRLGDVDGDGASALYGGGDCAPLDARRGAHAFEIPNNGLDEDCSGLDADAHRAPLVRATGRRYEGLKRRPSSRRPHILLVTTDALSFAHTGLGGYARPVTPRLDAWARRATTFTRAYSTSSSTANAIPALHTGKLAPAVPALLPPQNQERPGGRSAPTLADHARTKGYRSLMFPGAAMFGPDAWPGVASPFDTASIAPLARAAKGPSGKLYAAPELTRAALDALASAGDQPLLLWLHYFDHHPPYGRPPGDPRFGVETELDRYDSELAFADQYWGELFEGVEALLPPESYVIVFSADHGEAFDVDHVGAHHDQSLVDAETHVPFVIQSAARRGEQVDGLVSHLDVSATIEDWLDIAAPGSDGESLLPVLFDGAAPEKTFVPAVLWQPRGAPFGSPPLRMATLRSTQHLFVRDFERSRFGVYEYASDPLARADLALRDPELAEWGRWAIAEELRRATRP